MGTKGFVRNIPPLNILGAEDIESVHRGMLEVLWTTGVRMEHERSLKLLESAGCKVDYEQRRVRMPPALVEECIRRAPSSFPLRARDPSRNLMMGGNTLYFAPAPGQHTVDLDTWEPRSPTRKEYCEGVRVLDYLPTLHFFTTYTPYFGFTGVPPCMAMLESLAARVRNSSKCVVVGHSDGSEQFAIQIAQALDIEVIGTCTAAPPLTFFADALESAFHLAEAGMAVRITGAPVMGASAPATLAGSLVSNLVEVISGVVLVQTIRPGTRVMVLDFAMPMNMSTGAPAFGNIAVCLHIAAFNQIFRHYGIPTYNADGYPGSKRPDFQSAYEKSFRAIFTGLSGGSSRPLHGGIYGELSHHPIQAVLDDDIAGMVGRFLEGVTVNDETLALDLIEQVGPVPGHFLSSPHTRKWWRSEQYLPHVADRLTYPEWLASGKKSCLDYARERLEEILETHRPTPLSAGQEADVERILEDARQHYSKAGQISSAEMQSYRAALQTPDGTSV
jgi:trimethylamine--corrinoid protein Co-methyltransferase